MHSKAKQKTKKVACAVVCYSDGFKEKELWDQNDKKDRSGEKSFSELCWQRGLRIEKKEERLAIQ